jgi:SAM-dependent methyltransferase
MNTTSNPSSSAAEAFGADYAREQMRRRHHPLRRRIKHFYIERVLGEVTGPTIDFGCGAGQILRRLPSGSVGIEVNTHLIDALRKEGLEVFKAAGDASDFALSGLPAGRFTSLVMSHVLEHLPQPEEALRTLLGSCARLGIQRVVIIVPGAKGFASDATHLVFIDQAWMSRFFAVPWAGFSCSPARYFPLPWAAAGGWSTYHETHFVFQRA